MVSFLLSEGSWLGCQYFQPLERFLLRAWFHWFELLQCRCIRHPTTISHTVYTVATPWRVFGPPALGNVLFGFTWHVPFMLRPTSSSSKLPVTSMDFFLKPYKSVQFCVFLIAHLLPTHKTLSFFNSLVSHVNSWELMQLRMRLTLWLGKSAEEIA